MAKSTALSVARLSTDLLDAIVETAPVAMVLADQNGIVRWVNREVESLFGYSRDELCEQLEQANREYEAKHLGRNRVHPPVAACRLGEHGLEGSTG